MNRLRPRTTVLSGATIGLIAGAAIYGAVSSSATDKAPTAPVASRPTVTVAAAPVGAAGCAAGQKLEKGVCIIHVQRTVVVPAPAVAFSGAASSPSTASTPGSGQPASGGTAVEPSGNAAAGSEHDSEEAENEADNESGNEAGNEAAEHAGDDGEHAKDAAADASDSDD